MQALQPERFRLLPLSTSWLLADCAEAKGKQDLWLRACPEVLEALREQAIIQSIESSNRLEGVTVPAERLRPVALGRTRPRDRSEEELAGYRRALRWVFTRQRPVRLEPRVVRHLHALAQEGSSDAGSWKARDNEIVELLPDGERRIRFRPTPARKTPRAVAALCESYRSALENEVAPAALLVATLVFDHLCIHPFRDGNGRVSRLLTTFLLLQQGFEVVRYVSLERLVEESKGDYYRALEASSAGWHAGTNDMTPWWNHFLGILRRAYRALGEQVEAAGSGSGKSALVRRAVQAEVGPFALRELAAQLPAVSRPLLKKVLAQMKAAGEVRLLGRGRGATWEYSGP